MTDTTPKWLQDGGDLANAPPYDRALLPLIDSMLPEYFSVRQATRALADTGKLKGYRGSSPESRAERAAKRYHAWKKTAGFEKWKRQNFVVPIASSFPTVLNRS
jgi:hypothetical protein